MRCRERLRTREMHRESKGRGRERECVCFFRKTLVFISKYLCDTARGVGCTSPHKGVPVASVKVQPAGTSRVKITELLLVRSGLKYRNNYFACTYELELID